MRDVRSKGYYEQMKGRGVRSLSYEDLHNVSKSATSDKDRFILIDAVGVEKSLKTESRPLERNPNLSMKDLLQGVAMGHRDDDTIQSLASRLTRLSKQLDKSGLDKVEKLAGKPLPQLARELLTAIDPDAINKQALVNAKQAEITRSEETLTENERQTAKEQLIDQACETFDNPETREMIESARREREQLIDHINLDTVSYSGYSSQAADNAEKVIQNFKDFIEQHKDDIQALSFFYQQPYQRRGLTFTMLEELHQALSKPPLLLTTEKLWNAYERVNQSNSQNNDKNKKQNTNPQRQLTDIISLIRFAIGLDTELKPYAEQVDAKFKKWIFRHNAQRSTAFTEQQTQWLRLIKDHITASCSIERDDFDYSPFSDHGGLQKAWVVFNNDDKNELDSLLTEMNQELIA
jgi:type I restriction enzyme R subunit